jgi:hypothetical protein
MAWCQYLDHHQQQLEMIREGLEQRGESYACFSTIELRNLQE